MDLPQFTVMPAGLDDWDRIWRRRDGIPQIHAPRLRTVVRMMLRSQDVQLRPHPWQAKKNVHSTEGNDLGVPARVFPQWMRCTGCDMLAGLSQFAYRNTHPFRTDLACFEHAKCTGRPGRGGRGGRKAARRPAVPARYLLACVDGCKNKTKLILVGASNLWFPATQSVIVMPESAAERTDDLADAIRIAMGEKLATFQADLTMLRFVLDGKVVLADVTDAQLAAAAAAAALPPASPEEQDERMREWDPVELLVPEWDYLQIDPIGPHHEDEASGLTLTKMDRDPDLPPAITRVLAVERLRKVNALIGFTRIDDMDRVGDLPRRLAPLTRTDHPTWTVATEDRGEGIFLQLDGDAVESWEARILGTELWAAHRESHHRNLDRRFSETAEKVDPDSRLKPPRYWLVHTLAHVLIRELAMTCGYSAASLSERLYAWPAAPGRTAAAGLLICTTASDSDGTLGGLVQLSRPDRLARVVSSALYRAQRCSSDPMCAMRTPQDPEDFLHGAACHCCVMASETSCEEANRFLDRRFLLDLPGSDVGFFPSVR